MKAVYLDDQQAFLRYLEIPGEGPPLIWLHGWQCSSSGELLPAAVQPQLHGRRSLLVDFLGYGHSDKPADFSYTYRDHARTVGQLIEALGLDECGLVGHSMGGLIGTFVAADVPDRVSLLIMAEGSLGAWGDPELGTEAEFVETGYPELVAAQAKSAVEDPDGTPAAHVAITRLADPRAIYRSAVSLAPETDPSVQSLLAEMTIPRWYLMGARSDPEPELQQELESMGVRWLVVPDSGHALGLQNPYGFADAVAQATRSWPAR
jgi:pimeloyl-ACP methyl ester carboxylesterase